MGRRDPPSRPADHRWAFGPLRTLEVVPDSGDDLARWILPLRARRLFDVPFLMADSSPRADASFLDPDPDPRLPGFAPSAPGDRGSVRGDIVLCPGRSGVTVPRKMAPAGICVPRHRYRPALSGSLHRLVRCLRRGRNVPA